MSKFVDLSHVVHDGMPGIRLRRPDGSVQEGTARIRTWLSREAMAECLNGEAAFEVSELSLPTPIGTYIDSPFNRYPDGRDISELTLDELILPGIVVDLRQHPPGTPAPASVLPAQADLANAAVLFNFGWDRHWGTDAYAPYPHIATELARDAADRGARLLGFDTGNADGPGMRAHPIHTEMLARGVLIVENLTGLDHLHGKSFRFFAMPIKGRGLASMCVRAFAELL
jgi:kynurenine formamidase